MKFNPNEDFHKNVNKLLSLLKNMLKGQKLDNKDLSDYFGKKDVNLNLCFFTFMPFPFDEYDDMDFDEMGDEEAYNTNAGDLEHLKFEINSHDEDFLKKHGLKF